MRWDAMLANVANDSSRMDRRVAARELADGGLEVMGAALRLCRVPSDRPLVTNKD
jgi:hypothetical protein